jgi:hypothetical protein
MLTEMTFTEPAVAHYYFQQCTDVYDSVTGQIYIN